MTKDANHQIGAVVVGGIILILVAFFWPDKTPEGPTVRQKNERRKQVEAVLLEYLPGDYLDTLNARQVAEGFDDSSMTAIWPPGEEAYEHGTQPIWVGSVSALRILLESRRKTDPSSAIP